MIQDLYTKWGRDRAGMVCNVNMYRGASVLIDTGKALGLPHHRVVQLTKRLGHHCGDQMATAIGQELGVNDRTVGWLATLVAAMEETPRHASIHNGGFVVTSRPLAECIPLEKARMKDRTVTVWDKDDIEAQGFVKTDVLGLGMLTCIRKCFDLVRETDGTTLALGTVPLEDPAVYDMFCSGDTVGVFQIESRAQQATTVLAALAGGTTRATLGLIHQTHFFRPPALVAKMVATLDQISNGRFVYFLDCGNQRDEYLAYGLLWDDDIETRVALMVEGLELTLALWKSREAVTFAGAHYRLDGAVCNPGPVQQPHPPIWFGG